MLFHNKNKLPGKIGTFVSYNNYFIIIIFLFLIISLVTTQRCIKCSNKIQQLCSSTSTIAYIMYHVKRLQQVRCIFYAQHRRLCVSFFAGVLHKCIVLLSFHNFIYLFIYFVSYLNYQYSIYVLCLTKLFKRCSQFCKKE